MAELNGAGLYDKYKVFEGDNRHKPTQEGIFTIVQSKAINGRQILIPVTVKIGETEIHSNLPINFQKMELMGRSNDGSEEVYFGGVEHLDNCQLKYFINQEDVRFVRYSEDHPE